MVVAGLTVGIADGVVSGDIGMALGRAIFGLAPRLAALSAGVVFVVVIGELGARFGFPHGLMQLSPFSHVPAVPSPPQVAVPLVVLAGIAGVLVTVGAFAFGRRDLVA